MKKNMHLGARPSTFQNAAYLRKHPTKAEELLWEKLRNNQIEGIRFRRQHPFIRYIADFYAHQLKLVIELDGSIHDEPSVRFTDADRELNIKVHGLLIARYTNDEIYKSIDDVVEDIKMIVREILAFKRKI